MQPTKNPGRVAGLLYVLMGLPAAFSLMYIPRTLIVSGDATATAINILGHEMLFRTGIVAVVVSSVFFLLLVMALYRLLSGVNKTHAALMVILVVVSVAIAFLNEVNNIAALTLFRGADFLSVFDKPQRDALAMLFLGLHSQGNFVNEIFWGLWLLPFGLLVMRSGFLPRILGILLIVNGFAYVAASLTWLLLPAYGAVVFNSMMPALLGELWIRAWLLIKGVKVQPAAATAS
ncbi:MAG: DUF4386 domain-containing protein [Thermoanaerobaculia bacterium]